MSSSANFIRLTGVRQNNLKNLDLDIRVGKMTVVTGLSGAGKSSLVFETLHAEGQRRYVETFNAYTRQFLEMMGRPDVDAIENIRPSIAIEQKNSVRTSRSTVGTMTELCDYFKAWFPTVAALHDPADGAVISDDSPQGAWSALAGGKAGPDPVLLCFPIRKPENLEWEEILEPLARQGYTRGVVSGAVVRLAETGAESLAGTPEILIVQDRMKIAPANRSRFLESSTTAFRHGHGGIRVLGADGSEIARFSEGLRSPVTGRRFRSPTPSLFSFNSPIGACPTCKGFGRVIGLNREMVVPDPSLSLNEGAVRPFQGKVYSNSLKDLRRHAGRVGLRMDVPWERLSEKERAFVWEGDPDYPTGDDGAWVDRWYGINRFFAWLERNVYKMHVRVFLSKYRSYDTCPDCGGARLGEESLCWRWRGRTLPELYRMEITRLLALLEEAGGTPGPDGRGDLLGPIHQRLRFLVETGLGYLTLDRPTRTLSGGETERVNLTTCLGTSMVDTLFVLDEPSVGLHPRDIDRLVGILRGLTAQGNTVVVVEHDERIMRAADRIIEIGPEPGRRGGRIVFEGTPGQILRSTRGLTGAYLSGRRSPPARTERRAVEMDQRRKDACGRLSIYGATKHNLDEVDLHLPLGRFVCVSGVSGSGKSTLLHRVIHDNLLRLRGEPAEDPARVRDIDASTPVGEVVRVDQSSLAKTPRSNPALLTGAWEEFRKALAATEEAVAAGMTPGTFSFNAGDGRCDHCQGLGYEQVEMQFLSDIYLPCPVCEGRRFKPEVLAIRLDGFSVDELLSMEVDDAIARFAHRTAIRDRLEPVGRVGLGYLPLGHPLNQLSGGESQRLKLVRHLGKMGPARGGALILVDEPTTGLHRHDIARLLEIFQELVDAGNSLVVVEHHPDVLAAADYLIEMGPGAGAEGGRIVACGTPEDIAAGRTETAPFLREAGVVGTSTGAADSGPVLLAAEPAGAYLPVGTGRRPRAITVEGATEHNLRDVRVEIPHGKTTVISGVSGSGKSTLAFDIIFAEGQRRFLESMSAYARQFVEQLPKPAVRHLSGLAPSVAIEQRVTHGTAKSTVATITEVAQYLRLLFARIGVQHNPRTGNAVLALPETSLIRFFREALPAGRPRRRSPLHLGAPLVRGRKGHHQPLADWAADRGFPFLVCDGDWTPPEAFRKLDRYREHDIDLILGDVSAFPGEEAENLFREALRLGHGSAFLEAADGSRRHFSRSRVDPETGEGFPDLDPKMFSWNSPRGWCPTCRGRGTLVDVAGDGADEPVCPDCGGTRLSERSRHVFLETASGEWVNLPGLLSMNAADLIRTLSGIRGGRREKRILSEIVPEIRERLQFMDRIGLDYLTLDRATRTLSGGEAQRIRLTSQLGSNLTGVLYVLDEPTIGLHARDNKRLLASIGELKKRGNTVLVVEHDEDVILAADRVIDMGPGAGVHGGEVVAEGTPARILRDPASVTGRCLRRQEPHPLRGERRAMPRAAKDWIRVEGIRLRNWKGGSARIPRRRLTGVCGVSGAGKSTLVREALRRSVAEALRQGKPALGAQALRKVFSAFPGQASPVAKISGLGGIRRVVEIDQSPIGKTSRSTPATYIGVFDLIRSSFASLPEARMRGLESGAFSFNTAGGRCEACKGAGTRRLEMNFLPDASVVCEECGGRRYRPDILEILWRDRSIADVLEMSFEEAAAFFDFDRRIRSILELMVETGLGYLRLGQPSPTLSGGEAQRLKLVSELAGASPGGGEVLYLLEEPTIGLHLSDCARLAGLLHRLVDEGNTVVVIEHQADILAEADHLLEIGPGGGTGGGEVLHCGTPEELAKEKKSPTGPCLRALL